MSLGNPERAVGGLAVRTPPGVELRPMGRTDVEATVRMARASHGLPPLDDTERVRPRFDALLNSVDVAPFLACDDSGPMGLGILQFRRRLNFATFEGWLSEWYVEPTARGRGVGRALLDALVAEWCLRGSHRLQIQVPADAEAAMAVLRRAGLEEWMLDFRRRPIESPLVAMLEGVTIRPLAASDGEAVTRLLSEFGPSRTPSPDRLDAVLRTFGEHARRVASGMAASIVAERDGEVVGVCSLEWRLPIWTDETHAWLSDLIVTERERGTGIGRALLAHALAGASEHGAAQVTLESGPSRQAAHGLYRAMGFDETGRTFRQMRTEPT